VVDVLFVVLVLGVETSERPIAVAFRGDGPEAEEERGEAEDHKTQDRDRRPIELTGTVWGLNALAVTFD
jgi:hypothetical protein